jgi:hypothetical protein
MLKELEYEFINDERRKTSKVKFDLLDRPENLKSITYKLKGQGNEASYYITIADIYTEIDQESQEIHTENDVIHVDFSNAQKYHRRPYEIFINSKSVDSYAYLTTITRLISAFLRTGHDYAFIAAELKQIVDPKGGYFKKGTFYISLIAEIGYILERHFISVAESNNK